MAIRRVEVFSAGCPACEETIRLVNEIACPSCGIEVLDMRDPEVAARARALRPGLRGPPVHRPAPRRDRPLPALRGRLTTGVRAMPPDADRRARAISLGIRAVVAVVLVAAIAGALLHPDARASLLQGWDLLLRRDLDGLRRWGRDLGPWAPLATTLLMIGQALAAPIPALLVTWTNSWMFGPFWGGLLSIAQATLAALVCFSLARALGRPLVARMASERTLERMDGLVTRYRAACRRRHRVHARPVRAPRAGRPFDVGDHQLLPFARLETYDTNAAVPEGWERDPALNIQEGTFGLSYRPIPTVVFKADLQLRDREYGLDEQQWNAGFGYMF